MNFLSLYFMLFLLGTEVPKSESDAFFVSPGISFGVTSYDNAVLSFGGEISFFQLKKESFWYGIYTDFVNIPYNETRFSVGPEVGYSFFGVDFGYLARIKNGFGNGIRGRILFSFVFVHFYLGGGIILDEGWDDSFGEIGVLFKLPLKIGDSWY